MNETNYLVFKQINLENRKTPIYEIYNKNDYLLGTIKWYGAWRKFCFFPNEDTIWDNKCILEVMNFLNKINLDRYKDRKENKNNE